MVAISLWLCRQPCHNVSSGDPGKLVPVRLFDVADVPCTRICLHVHMTSAGHLARYLGLISCIVQSH